MKKVYCKTCFDLIKINQCLKVILVMAEEKKIIYETQKRKRKGTIKAKHL